MYANVAEIHFSRLYVKDETLHVTLRFVNEARVVLFSQERKLPLDFPVVASHCCTPPKSSGECT